MTAISPLEPGRLGGLSWSFPTRFDFSRDRITVPLVGSEILRASHDFAIVFVEADGGWRPAAYLGDDEGRPGRYVDRDGAWLADYTPFWLRVHPFAMQSERVVVILDPGVVGVKGSHSFVSDAELSSAASSAERQVLNVVKGTGQLAEAAARLVASGATSVLELGSGQSIRIVESERFRALVARDLSDWVRTPKALELGIAAGFSSDRIARAKRPVPLGLARAAVSPQASQPVARARELNVDRLEPSSIPADLDWLDLGDKIDLG